MVGALKRLWGTDCVCEAIPLTILRPPGGGPLFGHIDSGEPHVSCACPAGLALPGGSHAPMPPLPARIAARDVHGLRASA